MFLLRLIAKLIASTNRSTTNKIMPNLDPRGVAGAFVSLITAPVIRLLLNQVKAQAKVPTRNSVMGRNSCFTFPLFPWVVILPAASIICLLFINKHINLV